MPAAGPKRSPAAGSRPAAATAAARPAGLPPPLRSQGVVHSERGVVGETLAGVDRAIAQALTQAGGDQLVVDAPADVVGTRRATVAPPRVVLAVRMQRAVGIHPAAATGRIGVFGQVGAQPVEPVALLRQAA